MVIDGIKGAIGIKIIKSGEVPKVLAGGGPCHEPRTYRIWSFSLTFGALQSFTVLKEVEDMGRSALRQCRVQDRMNFFLQFMAPQDRLLGIETESCPLLGQ